MSAQYLWLACLATAVSLAPTGGAAAMSEYKWKHRPLVVFAASGTDANLMRQRQIVTSLRPAFIDRKMVVIYVTGATVSADLAPPPSLSADALRQRYGVAAGEFKAVLVGKDGGAKLTSSKPIPAQTLFRTIDAMPMRADELRGGPK
jgi:hypothetical protein